MLLHYKLTLWVAMTLASTAAFGAVREVSESAIDYVQMTATPAMKVVHFKWLVNRESGGHVFRIEKSLDEKTWRMMAEVPSLSNHSELHTYTTSEINLPENIKEFFRLLRVDENGRAEVLDETSISHAALSGLFLIPPSKYDKGEVIFSCNSLIKTSIRLSVMDVDGKVKREEVHTFQAGYNRIVLDAQSFPPGTYMLVLRDGFGVQQTRTFSTLKSNKPKSKS